MGSTEIVGATPNDAAMSEAAEKPEPSAGPSEVSLAEALALAVEIHKAGDHDQAEKLYRRILEVDPRDSDALNFLGMIAMARDKPAEAVELIRQSLEINPAMGERYVNLGNVLLAARRVPEAVEAFERAVAMVPNSSTAHCNLGVAYAIQRRPDDADRAFRRAIELDASNADAYNNYANFLNRRGDVKGCLRNYINASKLRPDDPNVRRHLGAVYTALGDIEMAVKHYREWLAFEPEHPMAQHLLAACLGENLPDRAPDAFVKHAFDVFATSFDSKLASLGYRAPQLVEEALRRAGVPAEKRLDVLDAGCGTGLCGPLIAPYAATLHGVDLSARMLEQAKARGTYDSLEQEELTQFLSNRREAYDVVLSADTLCYFGRLDTAIDAAAGALRLGGWLIFTVERAEDGEAPQGHRLHPHGRYSHTRAYVARTLAAAGFDECDIVEDTLRQEAGDPVTGLVVTARKPRRNAVE